VAAAVAGAAVMSTALLHGFPVAKVLAAPSQAVATAVDAATAADKDKGEQAQGRERDRDRDSDRKDRVYERESPVQVVMRNAATFGFDASRDSFSLHVADGQPATVRGVAQRPGFQGGS
jgi:type III secretory pathway component EscV